MVIIMDTSYFRRGFGVMVFRDAFRHKNLFWKFLKYETNAEYMSGIDHLKSNGCNVLGIVCDGRRGLFRAFEGTPIQMCHFHQAAIIRRYLTSNPKSKAGKELRDIALILTSVGKEEFSEMLEGWNYKWKDYISEKSYNEETGKSFFTHKRLRSASRSLKTHMPHLFT